MGIEPWIGYGPWYIAQKEGYFKKLGLNVQIVNFNTDAERESAFASGNTDVTNMPTQTALRFEQQNIPGRIVLLEDESLTADAVIAKPPITSIKALKGKQVGYEQGTTSDILIHYALAANHMSPSDIKIVPMNASAAGEAAAAGKVQAAVTYEPYISTVLAQHKGFKRIYVAGVDPGLVSDVLVASHQHAQQQAGPGAGADEGLGDGDELLQHPSPAGGGDHRQGRRRVAAPGHLVLGREAVHDPAERDRPARLVRP